MPTPDEVLYRITAADLDAWLADNEPFGLADLIPAHRERLLACVRRMIEQDKAWDEHMVKAFKAGLDEWEPTVGEIEAEVPPQRPPADEEGR